MKNILVLGSTGSIGLSTLEVIGSMEGALRATGLAAGSNWELLRDQALQYRPEAVCLADPTHFSDLKAALAGESVELLCGEEGLEQLCRNSRAEMAVCGIMGAAGLGPAVACVESGMSLALANKESLVVAGPVLTRLAAEHGVAIVPVDSEHSAVHQCLRSGRAAEVTKITLTASGGPFVDWPAERIAAATVEEALNHPTWKMGAKITIDSATLMNKALEVIEAHWLFGLTAEQIEIVVHRQSIIHSLVEFADGSTIAQMGVPDMKLPIQYALTYPDRLAGIAPRLELAEVGPLTFERPDASRFGAVRLGHEAIRLGGTAGAVLSAANEAAVGLFLNREARFGQIIPIVEEVMTNHRAISDPSMDNLMEADRWARTEAKKCLSCSRVSGA